MHVSSAPGGTPPAEIAIDQDLVAGLLAAQHPDLAGLPLRLIDHGWDNALFRLGDDFVVRLPRRAAAAGLIDHEQTWLPLLAPCLPLPAPAPVRIGRPGAGFPWPWSIAPWIAGETADQAPPAAGQGLVFGRFLRALHQPAPPDAPANPGRGVPLGQRAAGIEERLRRLDAAGHIAPGVRAVWAAALAAQAEQSPTWLHGDLHPRNILVAQGRLSGIIDWGDLTAGDRATDLAAIWMLFDDPAERAAAWESYGEAAPATRARAAGWAVILGALLLDTGLVDHPAHARIGERTLRRLAGAD